MIFRACPRVLAYRIYRLLYLFAIPPTSATSERVFALLKAMFGDTQLGAIGDYLEAALMLRYNKRSVG